MERNEFFTHLDNRLTGIIERKRAHEQRIQNLRDMLAGQIIPEVVVILAAYEKFLASKGVQATTDHDNASFIFRLAYNDSTEYNVSLREDPELHERYLVTASAGPDGKYVHSRAPAPPHFDERWNVAEFEGFLQGVLDDFIARGEQHGGVTAEG